MTENEDYFKTLHKDIELVWTSEGFDINMDKDDFVRLTDLDTLRNDCLLTIITRFRELKDNPTYKEFGCKAYELIKSNKSTMVIYKLESYFKEALKSMRRVYSVDYVEVTETSDEPYKYNVAFQVRSLTDEIVYGETSVNNISSTNLIPTSIYCSSNQDYANPYEPCLITFKCLYGDNLPLTNEIVSIYVNNHLYTRRVTDSTGVCSFYYYPSMSSMDLEIYASFEGTSDKNKCKSNILSITSTNFYFKQLNGHLLMIYTDNTTPPSVTLDKTVVENEIHFVMSCDDPLTFHINDNWHLIGESIE